MGSKYASLQSLVNMYENPWPLNWADLFKNNHPLNVEIGFGLGEVLCEKAVQSPDVNYIGIEESWERLYRTLKRISSQSESLSIDIPNVRLLFCDAKFVFKYFFKEQSIEHIYCLFPCPWPKKSHTKHRLFSRSFLKLLNSRLKDHGSIQLVTDYLPFYDWVKEEAEGTGFEFGEERIEAQFNTKFENKWKEQGQHEFYELQFKKVQHHPLGEPGCDDMKAYRLKNFDPEAFDFQSIKNEKTTVVLKHKLYDSTKKILTLVVIVAEQGFTQYFRVEISRKDDIWMLYKADGQQFFPTPGVHDSLRMIYEQAESL